MNRYLEIVDGHLRYRLKWRLRLRLECIRFGFSSYVTDVVDGTRVKYRPTTDIGRSLFYNGAFERNELELCRQYIANTSTVLDIGANIGVHSLFFSRIAAKGLVISLEPSQDTFKLLLENIASRDNIVPLNMAASDRGRIAEFYVAEDDAYSSLKDTKRKAIERREKVVCCRIDDLCKNMNLTAVNFVKIDVEGCEQDVLNGMEWILQSYRPVILCEIYKGANSNMNPDTTVTSVINKGYAAFVLKNARQELFVQHDDDFYNYLFLPKHI